MAISMGTVTLGSRSGALPVVQRSQPVRASLIGHQRPNNGQPGPSLAGPSGRRQGKQQRMVVAQASSAGKDFDSILSDIADKFEKTDKKAAVIGYVAAGTIAFLFSEWLIHLPLLNVLLGFPIQLVGLLLLPYLVVKYGLDGDDYVVDISSASDRVVKKLPGFEK